MNGVSRVIVGVGDIEDGTRALAWALIEARRRGAQLHAIRTWRDGNPANPKTNNLHELLEEAARKTLIKAFGLATGGVPPGVACRLLTREGDAADVLLRYADRDEDLIVLGTSRCGPWWPFGQKTVHKCVRRAGCPVVVVPPVALARAMSVRKMMRELHRELKQLEEAGA